MGRLLPVLLLICLLLAACTTNEGDITQVVGPGDWQGPVVLWHSEMDSVVQGLVTLELSIRDSSAVGKVLLFVDGRITDSLASAPWRFEIVTDSLPDGLHLFEARAWDVHGNLGVSPVLRLAVANSSEDGQGPEMEWQTVPDGEARGTIAVDLAISDYSAVVRTLLFLDGLVADSLSAAPWRFEIVTDSLPDGLHLLQARAWDEHGNLGVSPILRVQVANVPPAGPRLLWVPDDYETIQSAINAAADFDTIRVRDGIYYETLNLFGKGLWLESQNGPVSTIIDGYGAQNAIYSSASTHKIVVRGFTIRFAGGITVDFDDGCQFGFFNNICIADSEAALLYAHRSAGEIRNNLFNARFICLEIWSLQGFVENNIFENATIAAMWNTNYGVNPVIYGHNLFWNNIEDYYNFEPHSSDIHGDPLMDLTNGILLPGSPAQDSGSPDIFDLDDSRSDIGPFGGPLAY